MRILGIESSCDETAAAVVENGRTVLSDVVASQVEEHKIYGGVVPEIASRRHAEAISGVVHEALTQANCTLAEVDAVAVTYAPGLIGALLVGVNFAKGLAFTSGKPLVPVHHLRAHIASDYLTHPDLEPPFLCLVVSGGHSHIVEVRDYTDFRVIGRTRDDAAGEAMDKAARAMGLPYPGGVHLDRVSETGNPNAFAFPHPRVDGAPYDFSFSGLKTAVLNTINTAKQKDEPVCVPDLGASYIHAVTDCLIENTRKAAEDFHHTKIVLAGGVSANRVLRRRMRELCEQKQWSLFCPELKYCGDNGVMVAAQGYYELIAGHTADLSLNAVASLPIDA